METINEVKRYTSDQVLASQPGLEDAMHLVMLNALPSGASNDRMFLKVTAGNLAGLELLWDQPSLSWVVKGAHVPEDESTRLLDEPSHPKRRSDVEIIASLQQQVSDLRAQLRTSNDLMGELVDWCEQNGLGGELTQAIRETLAEAKGGASC